MARPVELLLLTGSDEAAASMASSFAAMLTAMPKGNGGLVILVDVVDDIATMQARFLDRGGHSLLIVCPSVTPAVAAQGLERLRAVDPELPVVVFGDMTLRGAAPGAVHRIRSFVPGSRAGVGAIQKLLCTL